jgi:hypothetical protein
LRACLESDTSDGVQHPEGKDSPSVNWPRFSVLVREVAEPVGAPADSADLVVEPVGG